MNVDEALVRWLVRLRQPALDPAMLLLSNRVFLLCALAAVSAALFATMERQRAAPLVVTMLIAVGLADLVGARVLKPLWQRPRPCHLNPAIALPQTCGAGASMPSNHAATVGAAATVLTLTLRRRYAIAAALFSAAVALSRVYLGVHYPSDVAVGLALGAAFGAACIGLWRQLRRATHAVPARPAERT